MKKKKKKDRDDPHPGALGRGLDGWGISTNLLVDVERCLQIGKEPEQLEDESLKGALEASLETSSKARQLKPTDLIRRGSSPGRGKADRVGVTRAGFPSQCYPNTIQM